MTRRFHPLPSALRALAASRPGAVLLESARPLGCGRRSYLYCDPERELRLDDPAEVRPFLATLERERRGGAFVAGWLGYEAGAALLDLPAPPLRAGAPVGWFGVYRRRWSFDHARGALTGPLPPPAREPAGEGVVPLEPPRFGLERGAYRRTLARIDALLRAGDSYQINFTDAVDAPVDPGAPLWPLYRRLLAAQPVDYAAFVRAAGLEIACLSPELFFRVEATDPPRATVRPMKGTAPRGPDLATDTQAAAALRTDPKSRAENVMIVDLLRNDLGRLARPGSVDVPSLFEVERYPTLLQMTSTVRADLPPGTGLDALFGALFPCGSVTGAPKRRSVEIIAALERGPRGVYTGAIGHAEPGGAAAFNVAIRTVERRGAALRMGVGSGVVIDSDPDAEYDECLLKARFLTDPRPLPALFETIRWERGSGAPLEARHLARLAEGAAWHGYPFDADAARARLRDAAVAAPAAARLRVRLELHPDGRLAATAAPFTDAAGPFALPADPGAEGAPLARVALAAAAIRSDSPRRRFKTVDRALYDRGTAAARSLGLADLLYRNERGSVVEGAISNLIARRGARFWTPPVADGALPGVCRAELLERDARLAERSLTAAELRAADALYLCNALRGVRRVALEEGPAIET